MEKNNYIIFDNYRKTLQDKCVNATDPRPRGFVNAYEVDRKGRRKLVGKSNLIVWSGRQIMLQKLLGLDRVAGSGEKDLTLFWWSHGSGGADPANPSNPIDPNAGDTSLTNEEKFIVGDPNYADSGNKKILPPVVWEQDALNGNSWLIAKFTIQLTSLEGNGHKVNELGLWLSDTNSPATASVFVPFAKVTLPSIDKYSGRILEWDWYLFF